MSRQIANPKAQTGMVSSPYRACPQCGQELSQWEQVLLSVDRAFICKECWCRIIIDINDTGMAEEDHPAALGE